MEEATELDQAELNYRSSDYVDLDQSESSDPTNGCGSGGAKYKLLSPAKLPISRFSCITIPPGLSPTSFLESPVLLSNMKVSSVIHSSRFFPGFIFIVWLLRKYERKIEIQPF